MTKRQFTDEEKDVFDLDKCIRPAPIISGRAYQIVSWIAGSQLFGWPFRNYISKSSLEPIEHVPIIEEPTFFPFEPYNGSETLTIDVGDDIEKQRQFLKDNTISYERHMNTVFDYHTMFMSDKMTPEDVLTNIKLQILKSDCEEPPLRCFTQLDWDIAMKAAEESTIRYRQKKPISVFDGIPVGVKEEIDVRGFRTNCGRQQNEEINIRDSEVVAAVRSLGVVIIGMTNMHELGMGVTGINISKGTPRNPYNPDHVTGGSSSGSAAAVSSGILPLALGSDGGGSVRIPCSFCGVQGLKPTFGRYSNRGTAAAESTVTSLGVIANNVADVALMHSLIAEKAANPKFFSSHTKLPAPCLSSCKINDIKFGTYSKYMSFCQPAIRKVFEENIKPKLNCLSEIEIPELYMAKTAHFNIILAETAQAVWAGEERILSPQSQIMYSICSRSSLRQYMQSSAQKTRAMNTFKSLFKTVDLIITPTNACLPKKINPNSLKFGELDEMNLLYTMWFVFLANLCGLPAMSINAGYTAEGLPVGVMIMGPWWREDLVLKAALELETKLEKPQRYYSPKFK